MLTRCPGCATAFRVHPEQLKARQGRVRCGQCQRVFNALDSLIEELVVVPPAAVPGDGLGTAGSAPAQELVAGVDAQAGAETLPALDISHIAEPIGAAEPALALGFVAVSPAPTSEALHADTPIGTLLGDVSTVAPPETAQWAAAPVESVSVGSVAIDAEPAVPEPIADEPVDTELEADETAEPSRFVWVWAGGIAVAIVALLLQGLLHFRVELATLVPETRPHFLAACELLGCRLELPRKVELLTIEGSDMQPDPAFPGKAGRLDLKVNLLNRAPFAQAWPALELTLTDTNDRPLLRRVMSAKEYLIARAPSAQELEQGIGPRQDVSIELALDTGEVVASGYRVYLFFP